MAKTLASAIRQGAVEQLQTLLAADASLANTTIIWGTDNRNHTEPLHFVSDCVFSGEISQTVAAQLAALLLHHGARVDGADGVESPLLGATSLSATGVADVLLDHGANVELTSLFGATALHWASYTGMPTIVERLITCGASHAARCTEFASTPLFWAVQGFSKYGARQSPAQVEAAAVLIRHGAEIDTRNSEGVSALQRSRESESDAMTQLLLQSSSANTGRTK